jgi:hypothetical protein
MLSLEIKDAIVAEGVPRPRCPQIVWGLLYASSSQIICRERERHPFPQICQISHAFRVRKFRGRF